MTPHSKKKKKLVTECHTGPRNCGGLLWTR